MLWVLNRNKTAFVHKHAFMNDVCQTSIFYADFDISTIAGIPSLTTALSYHQSGSYSVMQDSNQDARYHRVIESLRWIWKGYNIGKKFCLWGSSFEHNFLFAIEDRTLQRIHPSYHFLRREKYCVIYINWVPKGTNEIGADPYFAQCFAAPYLSTFPYRKMFNHLGRSLQERTKHVASCVAA